MIDMKADTMPQRPAETYGAIAKWFHWITFALVAAQFIIGWLMPDVHRGTQPVGLISLHLSIGLTILAVILLRFAWRLARGAPAALATQPIWQRHLADTVHFLLYLVVLIMVTTGWINAAGRGWTLSYFGLFSLPSFTVPRPSTIHTIADYHIALSWWFLGIIGFHVAAVLVHQLWYRDRTLQRMLPQGAARR